MSDTAWQRAVGYLSEHGGIATRGSLLDLGMGERMLRRRVAAGLLVRLDPTVVALPGTALDLRTRTRAAVLRHPDSIPTGASAAALLGNGPWDQTPLGHEPWLIGGRDRHVTARFVTHPGVRTVRAGRLRVAHPTDAIVDLLRFLPRDEALALGQRSALRGTVTMPSLLEKHARLAGLGGSTQLGHIIGDLADGARSEAERRLIALLRDAGFSGWVANHCIRAAGRRYAIDVAFPSARLAIGVDGRAFHSDARAFQRDRTRQNDLVADGWIVLRFTWADLVERPAYVLEAIAAGLAFRRGA
ncbi:MAG: DUF559 domain-containing protein [Candidatus Nanopelagicales bacterium]